MEKLYDKSILGLSILSTISSILLILTKLFRIKFTKEILIAFIVVFIITVLFALLAKAEHRPRFYSYIPVAINIVSFIIWMILSFSLIFRR